MRIVFMGTPDFAVPSLQILDEAGYVIAGVVTVADKPAGRGRKLKASPVKEYAENHNIPVLQPVKLRDPEFLASLEAWKADIFIVVAFRMLPEVVWSLPKIGTFNLHGSLLPDYRGAAPINWVLINGEKKTGLTTFFIDKQIDTGNLLLQTEVEIPFDWTAGELHDEMMQRGAELVLKTVQGLEKQELTPYPQDDSLYIHKAPKIFKEDCEINWEQSTEKVYNFIRGLSPYPAAWTSLNGQMLKLFKAKLVVKETEVTVKPGTLQLSDDGKKLQVACLDGWLSIEYLQLAGKKRMATLDFLRGYKESLTHVGKDIN